MDHQPIASFAEWDPLQYLADYYNRVEQDEELTLRFLTQQFRRIPSRPVALEFGIGPTVHHLLPLSPYVCEIHVADLLPANLSQVQRWQESRTDAHNWRPFTQYVMGSEGRPRPAEPDLAAREELTRKRITRYLTGDAALAHPLGKTAFGTYDCVVSCYCADSATGDKPTWRRYMKNILSLLRPGGLFVTTALRHCQFYRVGGKCFPSANVGEHDIGSLLSAHQARGLTVQVAHTPEHHDLGYGSIVMAAGFIDAPAGRVLPAAGPVSRRTSQEVASEPGL